MIVNVYPGDDGKSHFEHVVQKDWQTDWAIEAASGPINFRSRAPGYFYDLHNESRRQYVIKLLQHGEILAEVRVPPPAANTGSHYIKHSPRGAMDIATVGVAALVSLDGRNGPCSEARIALGAVAPTPVRAYAAEEMLQGQKISQELIESAANAAQEGIRPIDDIRGSAAHRKEIVGVLTRRTLKRALSSAATGPMTFEDQRRLTIQAAF